MDTQYLFDKVAEVRPDIYRFLEVTVPEVQESPFKDEIVEDMSGVVKLALSTVGNFALGVGALAVTGIANSLAGDLYDAARRGLTKSRNYKNMLAANPDLKNEDGQRVRRAFEVLHQFNPEFSSNPVVAGSFVRDQAQMNELGNVNMLTNLVSSRNTISNTRKLPIPGAVPMWDRESTMDKTHKSLQIKKLETEMKHYDSRLQEEMGKIREERENLRETKKKVMQEVRQKDDLHPFQMAKGRLETGPAARDILANKARVGRLDVRGNQLKNEELGVKVYDLLALSRGQRDEMEQWRYNGAAGGQRKLDLLNSPAFMQGAPKHVQDYLRQHGLVK